MRIFLAALLVVLGAGLGAWYWWSHREPPALPPPAAVPAPAAKAPEGPKHPLPPPPVPLPALNASDPLLVESLSSLLGPPSIAQWLNPEAVVRNIVATIDNLPRESVNARLNPVRPVPGIPRVTGKEATLELADANFARYNAVVSIADRLDARRAGDAYVAMYPLFQQAYVELGYPNGHFNDRLVEVIDHLLDAPEPKGPILLTQPKVLYEFADPDLESLSAGRKILVRVGPANAAKVKAKLRELRAEITRPR
jgi:hypothetical protein